MKIICFSSRVILITIIISISAIYSQTLNISNNILEEILVTNTNDSGSGSLREAIFAANHYLHINRNIIRFNIPKSDPGYDANKGVWTIKPDSIFENIIDRNLIIDGFSQSALIGEDTNPNGPEIVIDGSNAGTYSSCLVTNAEGTEIYGLTINRFGSAGIIFYFPGFGKVSGCYIGTDFSGMNAAGNKFGIGIWNKVKGVHIGPSEYDFPNVISGNTQMGIFISDSSKHNFIIRNYIGLNRDGTDTISNYFRGIDLERYCDSNEIFDNYIGGNLEGISLIKSSFNIIANNFIGTNESWEYNLGNSTSGIIIWSNSKGNLITGNIIGYNYLGIVVDSANSVQNVIRRNSISKNGHLGIDNRNSGNTELVPPTITSAVNNEIKGTAGPNQIIEIFADEDDEGQVYIDSTVTDASGNFTLAVSALPDLPNITATARDIDGNTSEFSSPFVVTDIENEKNQIPTEYALYQNYPNPYNPSTVINFTLPEPTKVKLSVYNLLGEKVAGLIDAKMTAGNHTADFNASHLSSGVYFYSISAGSFQKTKKMLLTK